MGTPSRTGTRTRVRTAGLALLLFAVLAFVVGSVLAITRDERSTPTARAPIPAPTSASALPSAVLYPPPAPSRSPAPPVLAPASPPGPPDAAAESVPVGEASAEDKGHVQVRVYNNSTIRGLAARAARDLTAAGWTVVEVGNYARGTVPTTTAYYQNTDQRAAAAALGAQFRMRVEPRFTGIASAGPGLIVIVTNDYYR